MRDGQAGACGRAAGAAAAQYEAFARRTRPDAAYTEVREDNLAVLRDVLGEDTFAARWTAGHGMTLKQAIAYAGESAKLVSDVLDGRRSEA